ncbi:MAG: hypothetical protein KME27_26025 [Lyngbya sp. HA4199-MV5]|nr:hypothetical protein [Lyngbya sp. HA4199-MV5]
MTRLPDQRLELYRFSNCRGSAINQCAILPKLLLILTDHLVQTHKLVDRAIKPL